MAKATCSVEGCDDLAKVRGWCSRHYRSQWYRWQRRKAAPVGVSIAPGQVLPVLSIARGRGGCQAFSNGEATLLRAYYEDNPAVKQSHLAVAYGVTNATMSRTLRRVDTRMRPKASFPQGPLHYAWTGGRNIDGNGYVELRVPTTSPYAAMRNANGGVKEHRLVMAAHLGRGLLPTETVHHINGNKQDNRIANLQLRFRAHGAGAVYRCCKCGSYEVAPAELHEEGC